MAWFIRMTVNYFLMKRPTLESDIIDSVLEKNCEIVFLKSLTVFVTVFICLGLFE